MEEKIRLCGSHSMNIRRAVLKDAGTVERIVQSTIATVYPRYYPKGAVDFFTSLHNGEAIAKDIMQGCVWLCLDEAKNAVGTVTIKLNEICRLFVLPECQRKGFGSQLLAFAETVVFQNYDEAVISVSLPAKPLYLKRGYKECEYITLPTDGGDFLCYDTMSKSVQNGWHGQSTSPDAERQSMVVLHGMD